MARNLPIEGIRYFLTGGDKADSPIIQECYERIVQVAGDVKGLMEQRGHALSRAKLARGQWMVTFTAPVKTFVKWLFVSELSVQGGQRVILSQVFWICPEPAGAQFSQLLTRAKGALLVVVWSAVIAVVLFAVVKFLLGQDAAGEEPDKLSAQGSEVTFDRPE